MDGAAPELMERYRRFLNGRGDAIAPLVCYLRGERGGARADSRAWAALILCRVYLLKGRLDLAASFLRLSFALFRSLEGRRLPLELWIDRAVILKWRGKSRRSETLLRTVLSSAERKGDPLAAAEAASHLAFLLARRGEIDEAASFLACAEDGHRALHHGEGLIRTELIGAMIDHGRGRCGEAFDRVWGYTQRFVDPVLGSANAGGPVPRHEMIAGMLLLLEWAILRGDEVAAHRLERSLTLRGDELDRFRFLRLQFLYLQHVLAVRRVDIDRSRRIWEEAEGLRRELGADAGCFAGCRPNRQPAGNGPRRDTLREASPEAVSRCGAQSGGAPSRWDSVAYRHGARAAVHRPETKIVTQDPRMLRMIEEARHSSSLFLPVLIEGETGSGKELFARMIHAWSGRRRHPFIPVNVAAIPSGLFESELFGHVRGAFTGAVGRRVGLVEAAGEGTLFLDEIGELDSAAQTKLLRLLDRGEFIPLGQSAVKISGARIVAATNRDLAAAVEAGEFRQDLFYRLKVLSYRIPPLRERRGDIPLLVRYFLGRCCARFELGPLRVSDAATSVLLRHRWPGNVRELEYEVVRAAVRRRRGVLHVYDFSIETAEESDCLDDPRGGTLAEKLALFERVEIRGALRDAGGNRTRAAALLGIKRTTLLSRMKRFGLE